MSPAKTQTTALAILAGGEARRLGGVVKPLIVDTRGRRLIDQIREAFESATSELFVLSTRRTEDALREAGYGPHLVLDEGTGPAGALASVARVTRCDWVVLSAGDLSSPSVRLLERLLAARESEKAVLVRRGDFLQPQLSVWPVGPLRQHGGLEGRSLRSVAEAVGSVVVPADQLTAEELLGLEGVNDPGDLARLLGITASSS